MTKTIKRIVRGGSADYGETIAMEFEYEDGSTEGFALSHLTLPKVVDHLRTFGQLAEGERRGRPDGSDLNVLVQPYMSAQTPRTAVTTQGEIGISYATVEGIPVTIVMPRDQARQLANRLKDALRLPTPKSGFRN